MFANSKKLLGLILGLVLVTCVFLFAVAAQRTSKKGGSVSVTGCLQKGDEANEFSLTGDDGKMYDLRSSSVNLADHVGHKVTVSGNIKAEADEDEDEAKESKESAKKEAGEIQVSKLKMVSESCQ